MVGHVRLMNVRAALTEVISRGVPGDFAELGVWRGGTCIFAKGIFEAHREHDRNVHGLSADQCRMDIGI